MLIYPKSVQYNIFLSAFLWCNRKLIKMKHNFTDKSRYFDKKIVN